MIHTNDDLSAVRESYVHAYYERFNFDVEYSLKTDEELRELTGLTYSTADCVTGRLSEAWRRDELGALNWFRRFAGLPPVVEDDAWSLIAQRQALTLTAEDTVTHHRTPDMRCYSAPTWATGAVAENAAGFGVRWGRGHGLPSMYIDDPGTQNSYGVGHRRTQLADRATRVGFGRTFEHSVDFADAFGYNGIWPTAGYFPAEELPQVWSSPDLNDVTVTRDGVPKTVTVINTVEGDGVTTWQIEDEDEPPSRDAIHTYHVAGTRPNGTPASWDVKVFNALYVPVAAITLNTTEATLRPNKVISLHATALPASHGSRDWKWTSSDDRVAQFLSMYRTANAKVKAGEPGAATITATVAGEAAPAAEFHLRVQAVDPPPVVPPRPRPAASRISVTARRTSLKVGRTTRLQVRYWPRRALRPQIKFRSSTPRIARVGRGGLVKARHPGRVRISARIAHRSITDHVVLRVVKPKRGSHLDRRSG